jgi:hypothetical protein
MPPLLEHPKLYAAPSAIHGTGLFAKTKFSPGDTLFRLAGEYTSGMYDDHYQIGPNWFSAGLNCWIVPDESSPGRFINHSCSANTQLRDDFTIAAIQRIDAGTEIVIDYSTTELDPHWQMECHCRIPSCRGTVKPFYEIFGIARQNVLAATPKMFRNIGELKIRK